MKIVRNCLDTPCQWLCYKLIKSIIIQHATTLCLNTELYYADLIAQYCDLFYFLYLFVVFFCFALSVLIDVHRWFLLLSLLCTFWQQGRNLLRTLCFYHSMSLDIKKLALLRSNKIRDDTNTTAYAIAILIYTTYTYLFARSG